MSSASEPRPDVTDDDEFMSAAREVDEAFAVTESWPEEHAEAARRLKRAVESFHTPVLDKFVRAMRSDPTATAILFDLVDDPHVRAVLTMHGLVRPPVPPEKTASEADASPATTTIIPIESIKVRNRASGGWVAGPRADEIGTDDTHRFDTTIAGELAFVLFTNVGGEIAAFRNACVHQGLTLDGARVVDGIITCPWHGFTFDALTGECISAPGAQLQRYPCRVDDGRIWFKP